MAGFEKEWGHRKPGYRKELKFFLDKGTTEYAAEKVMIYKKKLEIHIKKEDPDAILKYLKKLDDCEMTIDMIKPTGIGKMVTKLKKLADPGTKVSETCQKLIKKWKEIEKKFDEDVLKKAGLADYSKDKEEKKNELDEIVPGSKEADEYFRTTALSKRNWPDADTTLGEDDELNSSKRLKEDDEFMGLDDGTNIDDLEPGTKEFDEYIMRTAAVNKIKKTKDEEIFDKFLGDSDENDENDRPHITIERIADIAEIKTNDDSLATNSDPEDDNEYPQAQIIVQKVTDKEKDYGKGKDKSKDLDNTDADPSTSRDGQDDEGNGDKPKKTGPLLDKHGNWVDKQELNDYISKTFESYALDIISNVKKQYGLMCEQFDEITYYNIYGRQMKQDFPCPKCDKVWDESLELMGHLVVHFPGPDVVPDTFESCYTQIIANIEGDHRNYCKKMKKRRKLKGLQNRHQAKYSKNKEGSYNIPFQCPKCDGVEREVMDFRKHVLKHWNFYSIKCEECSQRFKGGGVMGSHEAYLSHAIKCKNKNEKLTFNVKKPSVKLSIKQTTSGSYSSTIPKDKGKLSCQGCERRFYTKKALTIHVLKAKPTKKKPFKCALCCENFSQASSLTKHNEESHRNGPIQTSMCPHCQCICAGIPDVHKHILEIHGEFADLYVDDVDNEDELKSFEKDRIQADKEERSRKEKERKEERERLEKEEAELNRNEGFDDGSFGNERAQQHKERLKKRGENSFPQTKRKPPTISESLRFLNEEEKLNEMEGAFAETGQRLSNIAKDKDGGNAESEGNYSDLDKDFEDIMNNIRKRNERYNKEKELEEEEEGTKKTKNKPSRDTDQNNNGHHKKSSMGNKDKSTSKRINENDDNDPLLRYSQHRKDMEEIMKLWN